MALLRALAVADALKRLNVPDDHITVIGLGGAYPLLPGLPNDIQNQRTEIILAVDEQSDDKQAP